MPHGLPALSLFVTLSFTVVAQAEEKPRRGETGEGWFGSSAIVDSTEQSPSAPGHSQGEVTQSGARPSAPTESESSASPIPQRASRVAPALSPAVPIRFEPDDTTVHLLDQNGFMPYENIVPSEWPGWWGWPYPYGYYHSTGVAPVYSPVCEGPCLARVRRGTHQFALAKQGGTIVPIAGQATIIEPSILRARYVDHSGQRTLGVAIGVVGALGGLIMMIASVHDEQQCDGYTCTTRPTVDDAWAISGVAVFAGSIITSAILLNQRDFAQISVSPLRLASPDHRIDPYGTSSRGSWSEGAAVTLHL